MIPVQERPVLCVGSAASSGSTLLADLLDSVPGMACGPELNIFCSDDAFAFDDSFRRAALARLPLPIRSSLIAANRFFNTRHLAAVGLNDDTLNQLIRESENLPDFVDRFTRIFATFRDKDVRVLAEKTPQNIGHAESFLKHFPRGVFVHIVRDGRAVCASIKRRGYSLAEAALIWLWETDVGSRVAEGHSRVVEIRYEDLVASPFETVCTLVKRVGLDVDPTEVERTYVNNDYRAGLSRVPTWRASTHTGRIHQDLNDRTDLSGDDLLFLEGCELLGPDGRCISFAGQLERYGYPLGEGGRIDLRRYAGYIREYYETSRNIPIQAEHTLVMNADALDDTPRFPGGLFWESLIRGRDAALLARQQRMNWRMARKRPTPRR